MPERSTLAQVVQLGVETTAGTAVAASKKLSALSIDASPSVESDVFRPMGQKYASLATVNKESVEADLSGRPTYSEIVYPLASLLTTPTISQIMDGATGTGGYTWTFAPSSTAEDTPKTFTVEVGSSVRAHRFAYGLVTELGINFSRDGLELSGAMMAQRLTDGVTLTANPTTIELKPILPTQVDIFLDDTSAGLGTTKLLRARNADFTLGDRFNPVWILDSTKPSYAAHVEGEPTFDLSLTVQADAQGMALLDTLRAGATKFMRIRAVGSQIYSGGVTVNYQYTQDMALKVQGTGGFDDDDGMYTITWDFVGVHDATWGKALNIAVINTQSAL